MFNEQQERKGKKEGQGREERRLEEREGENGGLVPDVKTVTLTCVPWWAVSPLQQTQPRHLQFRRATDMGSDGVTGEAQGQWLVAFGSSLSQQPTVPLRMCSLGPRGSDGV